MVTKNTVGRCYLLENVNALCDKLLVLLLNFWFLELRDAERVEVTTKKDKVRL